MSGTAMASTRAQADRKTVDGSVACRHTHALRRLHDVTCPLARRQPVTAGEPGSAFQDVDRSHPGILST